MSTSSRNLFIQTDQVPNWFVLVAGSVRCAGHVGTLEWKGPHFRDDWFRLTPVEVESLPFLAMWLCIGRLPNSGREDQEKESRKEAPELEEPLLAPRIPATATAIKEQFEEFAQAIVEPKIASDGFSLFANFEPPDELLREVGLVAKMILDSGNYEDAYDESKMRKLLNHQRRCREIFESVSAQKVLPRKLRSSNVNVAPNEVEEISSIFPFERGKSVPNAPE